MVTIRICKICGAKIYYKPVFTSGRVAGIYGGSDGYFRSFQKMNLDKTDHNCEVDLASIAGDLAVKEMDRKNEEFYKSLENY